ncbi:hypothetical protein SRABI128_03378 [Microbacterium sp. Bi128]|nr:hypothetical protein SRABI128_03378 [Microbacterium sp. Bi128]
MRGLVRRVVVDVHLGELLAPHRHEVEEALEGGAFLVEGVGPQRAVALAGVDPAEEVIDAPVRAVALGVERIALEVEEQVAVVRTGKDAERLGRDHLERRNDVLPRRPVARRALELQPGLRPQRGERVDAHRRRRRTGGGEGVDRVDPAGAQPIALHRAHARDQEQVAVSHDLDLARRATAARDHGELAPGVAPGQHRARGAEVDPPVGDEGAQARTAQREDGHQVVDSMGTRTAVAQEQLHLVGPRHPEPVELVDIGGQLHEGRDAGAAGELGVLHDPRPRATVIGRRFADEEVGEPHELVGREGGLVHDLGRGIGQRLAGEAHRLGERIRVGGAGRRDLADGRTEAPTVVLEHAQLVRGPQCRGALEGGILGVGHGSDAADLRVDRPEPRELALGCRFEVAGAPDDPGLLLDVPHGGQR